MRRPRDRDYSKEYQDYHGTAVQKKRRAGRNAARSIAQAAGRVHKGDGKEVDHKDNNTLNNSPGNTSVVSAKVIRSKERRTI